MNVVIIGGSGAMGKNLLNFFARNDISATPVGRKTVDFQKIVESADVLFISVPISAVEATVQKISGYDLEHTIVINLASNMSKGSHQLLSLPCESLCMHMLFGPDIVSYKEKNIIVSPQSSNASLLALMRLFEKDGAIITFTTPTHHDEMMGYVQAISHFVLISLGATLAKSSSNVEELLTYAPFSFKQTVGIYERLAKQPAELWANIQFSSKNFPDVFDQFIQTVTDLKTSVDKKDLESYENIFTPMKSFWNASGELLAAPPLQEEILPFTGDFGTLGPKGTHSHNAIKKFLQSQDTSNSNIDFYGTISEVVQAVAKGDLQVGLVPFENSTKGMVIEALESIAKNNVFVTHKLQVPIKHCIAGTVGAKTSIIKKVFSHPQALFQCQDYIAKHYPTAKCEEMVSTAAAFAKLELESDSTQLAIGSELGAQLHNLKIIDTNVQDVDTNVTSFVAISKEPSLDEGNKTKVLLIPNEDRSGLLFEILKVFEKENINVSSIDSRPSKKSLGTYIFYLTIDVGASAIKALFEDITALGVTARSLGSYVELK
jgi:prephenate dehydratase/prephenate dehydrogenase